MRKETMDALIDAAVSLDVKLERRPEYSGRGMINNSTCAVICGGTADLVAAAAQAGADIARTSDQHAPAEEALEEFLEDLKGIQIDSIGMGLVAY